MPPHVREMAVRRATERGMTVGDWVAEAIVGFVRSDRAQSDRSNLPAAEPPPDMAQILRRLDERISRLERRQPVKFFGRLFGRRDSTTPENA